MPQKILRLAILGLIAAALPIFPIHYFFRHVLPQANYTPEKEKTFAKRPSSEGSHPNPWEMPADMPNTIIASGANIHLGKTFEDMTSRYGMCILNEAQKPERSESIWPDELEKVGTAQAEWNKAGQLITLLWLPPEGAKGPSEIVRIRAFSTLNQNQILKALHANAPAAWQTAPPHKVRRQFEHNPKFLDALEYGRLKEFSYWRMDGASVHITTHTITIRSEKISLEIAKALESRFTSPTPINTANVEEP
jgi:hypothetical protein